MNKGALIGILVAVMIPVLSYLTVKLASEKAVVMPKRYFADDVIEGVVDGKKSSDTVWHRTENFRFVNQLGDTVELYDIQNKIIVADFIFTRCPVICPTMTKNMRKLQESFAKHKRGRNVIDSSIVHFLTFTVDPAYDSVPVLKAYADRFGANHDNWWFLTGDKKDLYDFAFSEMKLAIAEKDIDTSFAHTQKFVLLDKNYVIRGPKDPSKAYYDGTDSNSVKELAMDIGLLMLEKDQKAKSTVFTQILDLSWLWLIVIFLVIAFSLYIRKRRKITERQVNK
ncbi:MAG: cytochrome oxidase biosis protein Sco1/SenC/PrrC, putative copper metallochaperone [Chitinophagaceae bacterium]|jgi:protein SCO1/2|nr:cytochrome oxidase biosis protein Sco1/SenC/PrrC, putative copper metallochaperone [Chitinophagaceae bacterium]